MTKFQIIKMLATKRYNPIDALGMMYSMILISHECYGTALVVFLTAILLSTLVEYRVLLGELNEQLTPLDKE